MRRDDTVPDRPEADTDPIPARSGTTDPTWPNAAPPLVTSASNDTDPSSFVPSSGDTGDGLDDLLGGLGKRGPKLAQRAQESAGREAAHYDAVAEPARARSGEVDGSTPAVILNTTEPMLRQAPQVGATPEATTERVARRPLETSTVPGVRQRGENKKRTEIRRGFVVLAVILATAFLIAFALRGRTSRESDSANAASSTATVSAAAPSLTIPSPNVEPTPTVIASSTPPAPQAPPSATAPEPPQTVAPPRPPTPTSRLPEPRPATSHSAPAPRPSPPPTSTSRPQEANDHVRSL
jgi:hypothetical protein